jgi:serine/threonine-protein kinase HipA
MNKCLITYETNSGDFSMAGLRQLNKKLSTLAPLEFTQTELRTEAMAISDKISIQGIQPKLSARLNIKQNRFDIVDAKGTYIIKVQVPDRPQMPENEDLTMKMAKIIGIDTPVHGLVRDKEGALNYFIKRFDRYGQKAKYAAEDFAQLTERTSGTKYDATTESLIPVIQQYCTFPTIELAKLFKRIFFSFMVGNEDMHLKNFSLITKKGKTQLSPAYDLINSSIILKNSKEELALPLMGTKARFKPFHFRDYLGQEKMLLRAVIIDSIFEEVYNAKVEWHRLVEQSFLSDEVKEKYLTLLEDRFKRMY